MCFDFVLRNIISFTRNKYLFGSMLIKTDYSLLARSLDVRLDDVFLIYFSYHLSKTYIVGTRMDHLNEIVLFGYQKHVSAKQ